jgi:hypothetical protein
MKHIHNFVLTDEKKISSKSIKVFIRCLVCGKERSAYIGTDEGCFPTLESYNSAVRSFP